MESSTAILLLIAALVIVSALAFIALRSTTAVKQKQLKNDKNLELLMQDQQQRRDYAQQSIRLLTLGAMDEQVPLVEACIRINGLFDFMGHDENLRLPYTIFADIATQTSHIPTKEDWKDLKRKERRGYEQLMLRLEQQHKKAILTALSELKNNGFLDPKAASSEPQFYQA
ncbi:hypothetical protein SIN8267_00993 [Sinobacterium norvegicum]|uniref:DUF2489 domain-containing protein n=1 Tax=Sinobacterium norvegicum TaxID=1641715 RepID=A0ABM9AD49_9GAMM|nr:DUF2489 domain-containing protein [Sinobacterium norvegicum]CAH0990893.1 hypothetical protein SIN8267_00993 [Sinobacterium norvegicum]